MRVCGCNWEAPKANKTHENRSVRIGQVELANRRDELRLSARITWGNHSAFFPKSQLSRNCHAMNGKGRSFANKKRRVKEKMGCQGSSQVTDCASLASALARFGKVGREATNQKVGSSSPPGRTTFTSFSYKPHQLAIVPHRRGCNENGTDHMTFLIGLIRAFEVLSNLVSEPRLIAALRFPAAVPKAGIGGD
jgi:hypothetical protein